MVHDAARTGCDQQADAYASVQPGYHPALVERFIANYAHGVVVDVAAGTGIFTSQLVEAGCIPIAIEPVASMRNVIVDANPTVTVIDGTAENTGLGDHSVDTVVAAQAFHWFDHDAALAEIERILRPDGFLVCGWNVRDESVDWVRRYTDVVDRFAGDTPRHRTMHWRGPTGSCRSAPAILTTGWTTTSPDGTRHRNRSQPDLPRNVTLSRAYAQTTFVQIRRMCPR